MQLEEGIRFATHGGVEEAKGLGFEEVFCHSRLLKSYAWRGGVLGIMKRIPLAHMVVGRKYTLCVVG